MKILIIEDTDYKIHDLEQLLAGMKMQLEIKIARSFQTGRHALKTFSPHLVLLDMTLQTSEREDGQLEGRNRIYGGRELLAEIEFNDVKTKVVVVTQFDHFGEQPKSMDSTTLFRQLRERFPNIFIDGVFYSNIDSSWQVNLRRIIKKCHQEYENTDRR